jgi:UDP-N-acetylmuramate dehydrogenase
MAGPQAAGQAALEAALRLSREARGAAEPDEDDRERVRRLAVLARSGLGAVRMASLARHSTMRVGGPAVVVEPGEPGRLPDLFGLLARRGWPAMVVGQGSNVLFPDQGLTAPVVRLVGNLSDIRLGSGGLVEAGAGASTARLGAWAAERGLSGLEFMAGIPGTVGGAAWGNAGAAGRSFSEAAAELTIHTPERGFERLPMALFRPAYRRLGPPEGRAGAVVVSAALALTESTPAKVKAAMAERLAQRARGQPGGRSLGCVFMNPEGDSAGRLIDLCGLKGRRLGGAMISEVHANFIINRRLATAADVLGLARLARDEVRGRFGVELEPEIRIVDASGRTVGLGGGGQDGARDGAQDGGRPAGPAPAEGGR